MELKPRANQALRATSMAAQARNASSFPYWFWLICRVIAKKDYGRACQKNMLSIQESVFVQGHNFQ